MALQTKYHHTTIDSQKVSDLVSLKDIEKSQFTAKHSQPHVLDMDGHMVLGIPNTCRLPIANTNTSLCRLGMMRTARLVANSGRKWLLTCPNEFFRVLVIIVLTLSMV